MLRAPPLGHPLQKCTVVQWDMGALHDADGGTGESMSPQFGNRLLVCDHYIRRGGPTGDRAAYQRKAPLRRGLG